MKFIFSIFSLLMMCGSSMAQNNSTADSMTVYVNGVATGTSLFTGEETATTFTIKKNTFKKVKTFTVVISGNSVRNERYKRTVEAALSPAARFEENKNYPGHFNIYNSAIIKDLNAGKTIPLYLVMEPANPMMMFPSKRLLMGALQLQ
ncbi:MAG: hypothetical protein JST86_10130 [Bacteroidetes bacterium]|nr:hypothetical protein [Bacteroidota bacterium]